MTTPSDTKHRPPGSATIRVGVNGYGTVGKRIADAISLQPDMSVCGVTKTTPGVDSLLGLSKGYALFVPQSERDDFRHQCPDVNIEGDVPDLVNKSDVIVDATPSGIGRHYNQLYRKSDTKVVYQGGEDADIAQSSFTARESFNDIEEQSALRVLSCNSTGLVRLLGTISDHHVINRVHATLVRRGGDPDEATRGPINDIVPDPVTVPSHHGPDVQTVLPQIEITTTALRVPATLMHVQAVDVHFEDTPTRESVVAMLENEPRIQLINNQDNLSSCASIKTMAADAGRPRGDVWENCVWKDSITMDNGTMHFIQAIDQRAIIIPENIDAIRALGGNHESTESMRRTNTVLTPRIGAMIPTSPNVVERGADIVK